MFFRGNDIGNEIKKAETRNDKKIVRFRPSAFANIVWLVNIGIQGMPVFDGRNDTHFDHFITKLAQVFVALFQFFLFRRRSGHLFISNAIFSMEVSIAIMMWLNLSLDT